MTDVIQALNRHLARDVVSTSRFMTLFYLTVDAERRALEWVRAGHEPALRYDPESQSFEELRGPGMALGIDARYKRPQANQRRRPAALFPPGPMIPAAMKSHRQRASG